MEKYLAGCHNCVPGGKYPDSVFAYMDDPKALKAQFEFGMDEN